MFDIFIVESAYFFTLSSTHFIRGSREKRYAAIFRLWGNHSNGDGGPCHQANACKKIDTLCWTDRKSPRIFPIKARIKRQNCRGNISSLLSGALLGKPVSAPLIYWRTNYRFCCTVRAYRVQVSPCKIDDTPLARRSVSRNWIADSSCKLPWSQRASIAMYPSTLPNLCLWRNS